MSQLVKYSRNDQAALVELKKKMQRFAHERGIDLAARQGLTSLPPPTRCQAPHAPGGQFDQDGAIIDLPRFCAYDGGPYVARYQRHNGVWELSGMNVSTQMIWRLQYEDNSNIGFMANEHTAHEICPRCGAEGGPRSRGAARCHRCSSEICYGRTVADYFRCRPSCGAEGLLSATKWTTQGLGPRGAR